MTKSKIYLENKVENTARKFGSATEYYPVKIESSSGVEKWAMFTITEIEEAITRADKNREDIPQTIWEKLFG